MTLAIDVNFKCAGNAEIYTENGRHGDGTGLLQDGGFIITLKNIHCQHIIKIDIILADSRGCDYGGRASVNYYAVQTVHHMCHI